MKSRVTIQDYDRKKAEPKTCLKAVQTNSLEKRSFIFILEISFLSRGKTINFQFAISTGRIWIGPWGRRSQ